MDVEQKVNDLGANVNIGGTIVPTILKREAKSSLAVQDKSTIVLGGLIQQSKSLTTTKTPFFGDIPIFGQIFKSQENNKKRTELIIFIRPTVLRTDTAAVAEARRRLKMLGVSEDLQQRYFNGADPATTLAPSTRPTSTAPVPESQPIAAQPQPAVENPTDLQPTKVKALKLEDGDISSQ